MIYLILLSLIAGLLAAWLMLGSGAALESAILSLARSMDPSRIYGGISSGKDKRGSNARP